jgi:hypothetical protein
MPLVLDPSGWDRERLLALIRMQLEGLEETLGRVQDLGPRWSDPTSLRTAIDLLEDAQALAQGALDRSNAEPRELALVANVEYDAMLAGIDLLKSHTDLAKVPRPSRPE